MAQPSHVFLRLLRSSGRRTVPWLVAVLLGLGLTLTGVVPAEAATKAPSGLTVKVSGATTLDVSWKAVKGAPRYRVAYATASSMKKALYRRVTDHSVQLTGLKPGQRYYVKVRVITSAGQALSKYSGKVRATTAKGYAVPDGLTVTDTGSSSVALDWDSSGSGLTYRIQYATDASMAGAVYRRFDTSSGSITDLDPATTYWFKVRVITADGANLSDYSAAVRAQTDAATSSSPPSGSAKLRVATFNIKCTSCFSSLPNEGTWYQRRDAVVATIKSQDPDVIGVQEASQAWLKDENGKSVSLSQFEDLRNRLGGSWTLTNSHRNNCVKSTSPVHCQFKDQGASQGTKILFDAERVQMLDNGSELLSSADSTANPRYMAWAVLRQRSTGKDFFFADAHLDHGASLNAVRKVQAEDMAATIKRHNPDRLPVVVVGDWNSSRFAEPDNAPYDVLVAAGYHDPLGQTYRSTKTAPGATVKHRINTWMNSFNDFVRQAKGNRSWVNGSYIDYMLMSPSIEVDEWENVADLDGDDNFVGTIPSDHNMQRATVVLP